MSNYESSFGKTEFGILRGGSIKHTYDAEFYLNEYKNIVGLVSNNINSGELLGEKTENIITELGVGMIIKYIIENKIFKNIDEFLKEINIVYSIKINNILLNGKNEKKRKGYISKKYNKNS